MTHVINIIIELGCLIAALFFLKSDTSKFSLITIFYLTIVCITEIAGLLYVRAFHQSNAWIYNIFIIFEVSYISYGLYIALKSLTNRAIFICSSPLLIFWSAYTYEILNHDFLKFHSLTINIASVAFVLICLIYFYLLIKQKDPIDLRIHSHFWWVMGVLFYYFGGTIYNLFIYILYQHIPKSYTILIYIMLELNTLLYSIWIYSFICSYRQQKLLSSLP